jgi:ABC-type antimicrobial peptide transport system ATPase subunit
MPDIRKISVRFIGYAEGYVGQEGCGKGKVTTVLCGKGNENHIMGKDCFVHRRII